MKLSLRLILFSSLTILLVICIAYVSILDSRVINKLEGVLWTVPAKVYARPLELAEGGNINIGQLKRELEILSYEQTKKMPDTQENFHLIRILQVYSLEALKVRNQVSTNYNLRKTE